MIFQKVGAEHTCLHYDAWPHNITVAPFFTPRISALDTASQAAARPHRTSSSPPDGAGSHPGRAAQTATLRPAKTPEKRRSHNDVCIVVVVVASSPLLRLRDLARAKRPLLHMYRCYCCCCCCCSCEGFEEGRDEE